MTEGLITTLNAIGTPVVIIAAAAVAFVLRSISTQLAIAGGVITLLAVAAYVPIDLYPKARDAWGNIHVEVSPQKFESFSKDMSPTDVSIIVKRGEQEIAKKSIPSPNLEVFSENTIVLKRIAEKDSFSAMVGTTPIGLISDRELETKGFYQKTPEKAPQYIASSKAVYKGMSWSFDNAQLGKVKLTFVGYENGKPLIEVTSSVHGNPQPEKIALANKTFGTLSFNGQYEMTIHIREASLNQTGGEWIAFNVIVVA